MKYSKISRRVVMATALHSFEYLHAGYLVKVGLTTVPSIRI